MDLEIIEAPVAEDGAHPGKRTLVYPMEISLARRDQQKPAEPPHPPPSGNDGRRHRRRRQQRGSLADPSA
jgi:hypothetical protein